MALYYMHQHDLATFEKMCYPRLDQRTLALVIDGVNGALEDLDICLSLQPKRYTKDAKNPDHNTAKSYRKMGNYMRYFLARRGKWEDLLLFLERAPEVSPALCEKEVELAIRCKMLGKGEPLLSLDGGQPVLDAHGEPMLCLGQWNDPRQITQFRSAITSLLRAGKHKGEFEEEDAEELYNSARHASLQSAILYRDSLIGYFLMVKNNEDQSNMVPRFRSKFVKSETEAMSVNTSSLNVLPDEEALGGLCLTAYNSDR